MNVTAAVASSSAILAWKAPSPASQKAKVAEKPLDRPSARSSGRQGLLMEMIRSDEAISSISRQFETS